MPHDKRLWVAAVILGGVILASFALSVPHAREVRDATVAQSAAATTTMPTVALTDAYAQGTHTLSGTVMAPDACSNVLALATYASTTGQGIELALTLTPATGVCLALPTAVAFKTTVEAPSGTAIETRLNGVLASTTSP